MNELRIQARDALNSLFDALNKMGGDFEINEALKEVLAKQHRTLQQNFMRRIIVPSIQIFAQKQADGYYDLRNEASCKLAAELLPITKKAILPFI